MDSALGKRCFCGMRRADSSAAVLCVLGVSAEVSGGGLPLPTTSADYFQPGTQPNQPAFDAIVSVNNCFFCHAQFDENSEPYRPWAASMMGQSARDPIFWACLAIANQDAVGAGEFCLRCHIPNAYVSGRAAIADGSALISQDFESINCNFCHRLVNPEFPVPGNGRVDLPRASQ